MPYKAVDTGKGKKPVKIKKRGKVIASSTSMKKARSSIRARNAAEHGWEPTRKGR